MYALGVMRRGFAPRKDDELGRLEDVFGGLGVVDDGAGGSRRARRDAIACDTARARVCV